MKKSHPYDVLSTKYRCHVCNIGIKERLVHQKQIPPRFCYRHWIEKKYVKVQKWGDMKKGIEKLAMEV